MSLNPVEPPAQVPPLPVYDWRNYPFFSSDSFVPQTEGPGAFTLIVSRPEGQATYRFTLDRLTVARHSSSFAKVFHGRGSYGRYIQASDGTLVVEVSGDMASDWQALIKAIYDPLYVQPKPSRRMPPHYLPQLVKISDRGSATQTAIHRNIFVRALLNRCHIHPRGGWFTAHCRQVLLQHRRAGYEGNRFTAPPRVPAGTVTHSSAHRGQHSQPQLRLERGHCTQYVGGIVQVAIEFFSATGDPHDHTCNLLPPPGGARCKQACGTVRPPDHRQGSLPCGYAILTRGGRTRSGLRPFQP